MSDLNGHPKPDPGAGRFEPTRWSLIIAAHNRDPEALGTFCQSYWFPVYAHLRRRGLSQEDAEDRTQDLFARLSQPNALNNVSADRGRFRTFILACAENEVRRWRAGETSQKKGGGSAMFSIDVQEAEAHLALQTASAEDPVVAYDRSFALAVVKRALDSVAIEYRRIQQERLFNDLRPLLMAPPEHGELVELATSLGMSEGNLRIRWHRLRHRFAELLLEELTQMVANPEDARSELRHLLAAVATSPTPIRNPNDPR